VKKKKRRRREILKGGKIVRRVIRSGGGEGGVQLDRFNSVSKTDRKKEQKQEAPLRESQILKVKKTEFDFQFSGGRLAKGGLTDSDGIKARATRMSRLSKVHSGEK